jgi:hypothetical protein
METIVALFFGAGLTLSVIAGMAIFAEAALRLLHGAWLWSIEAMQRATAPSALAGKKISQPRTL